MESTGLGELYPEILGTLALRLTGTTPISQFAKRFLTILTTSAINQSTNARISTVAEDFRRLGDFQNGPNLPRLKG